MPWASAFPAITLKITASRSFSTSTAGLAATRRSSAKQSFKVGPPSLPFEAQGPAAELRQFYVLGPWQGAGIAQQLMDWVIDEARRRGAGEIFLSVFVDNAFKGYGFSFDLNLVPSSSTGKFSMLSTQFSHTYYGMLNKNQANVQF